MENKIVKLIVLGITTQCAGMLSFIAYTSIFGLTF